jgi:hypothetical protein
MIPAIVQQFKSGISGSGVPAVSLTSQPETSDVVSESLLWSTTTYHATSLPESWKSKELPRPVLICRAKPRK